MDEANDSPLICHCMVVDETAIRRAIAAGAWTVEAVQDTTFASTGCGTCRSEIHRLLHEAGHRTDDQQLEPTGS